MIYWYQLVSDIAMMINGFIIVSLFLLCCCTTLSRISTLANTQFCIRTPHRPWAPPPSRPSPSIRLHRREVHAAPKSPRRTFRLSPLQSHQTSRMSAINLSNRERRIKRMSGQLTRADRRRRVQIKRRAARRSDDRSGVSDWAAFSA